MNHLYHKLWLLVVGLFLLPSCADDDPLEFHVDKPETVALQEEINQYADLKTYVDREANPNFKLGAGVAISDYLQFGVMHRLINRNFDEVTPGYGMKHGAVVQSNGSLNLNNLNNFLEATNEAGLSVYGHTLVWHANQNAGYLNGLLAPLVVQPPAFANSLDVSGLEAGTLEGWTYTSGGGSVSVVENEGMGGKANAVKLVSSASSSAPDNLQLVSPEIPVVPGHEYEVLFYIKSDAPGEGRIAFEGLTNNTPQIDWMNTGQPSETFSTSAGWKKVSFRISDFTGESFKILFDLGYAPNITYYLDINNIYVYDTQGEPIINNLIANGDFEAGNIDGWGGWGNSSTRALSEEGEGYGNTGYAIMVTNPSAVNFWEVQTVFGLGTPLEFGEEYVLSFYVKHNNPNGDIRPEMQSASWQDGADPFGTVYLTSDWKKVELRVTPTRADRINLIISYGTMAGTVYMDNFVLHKASGGGSSAEETIVEKTPEEKEQIIKGALENWISGMVTNSKNYVKAWDVVNEPMDDGNPSELKTGAGKALAPDEFYWQDYLGKDYGVTAFKLAREYGNADDLLFINDYNLEYNLDKSRGLIRYVEYLESNGAEVDGIGTQMHIDVASDKEKIAQMFELLAATGKLIKISELDIAVGVPTNQATPDHYKAQEEMYQYVTEKYMEIIPAAQRYGITVWSPIDSPEGSSWRPGEPIGLWTESLNRKPAYVGVANGIGGSK